MNIESMLSKSPEDTSEGGLLSILWRKILMDLNLVHRVPAMIHNYVESNGKQSLQVKKKSKSSITNDITASSMTWKVFLNLLISVLRVKKLKFTVTLEFRNGAKSSHSIDVDA